MKFVITKGKLENMLEMLMVKDILPKCILNAKGKTITSLQKDEHNRLARLLKLKESFFNSIDEVKEEEVIEFDAKKVINIIKNIPSNIITWKTDKNKIIISSENREYGIGIIEPENVEKDLPFKIVEGVPTFSDIPLDTKLKVKISDMRDISQNANTLSTEFIRFKAVDKKLIVRIGDVHDFDDYCAIDMVDAKIEDKGKLDAVFTYGVPQISATFRGDVDDVKDVKDACMNMRMKDDYPAWFYEKTNDHYLGVLVAPYIEEE